AARRRRAQRRPNPSRAGPQARIAAAAVAARSAGALPQDRARCVAGAGDRRRPQPPGAADDRIGGLAYVAPGEDRDRPLATAGAAAGPMAGAAGSAFPKLNKFRIEGVFYSPDVLGRAVAAVDSGNVASAEHRIQFHRAERLRMTNPTAHVSGSILVVDDQPANLRVVSALLSRHGYEVITADSGEEALAVASEQAPALMLLDMIMP